MSVSCPDTYPLGIHGLYSAAAFQSEPGEDMAKRRREDGWTRTQIAGNWNLFDVDFWCAVAQLSQSNNAAIVSRPCVPPGNDCFCVRLSCVQRPPPPQVLG